MEPHKKCTGCGEVKLLNEYYRRQNSNRDYLNSCCKVCSNIRRQQWGLKNPEKVALSWRKSVLKRYNLTLADYDAMLAAQGGGCAICGAKEPGGVGKRFAVDHDHACCPERMKSCGKCVRGLLCTYCNLHLAGEDLQRLRNAVGYLEDYLRRSAASASEAA